MSSRKAGSNDAKRTRGKLIYHAKEESKHIEGGVVDIIEKTVTHAEDTLFCKFYHRKGDSVVKYEVKAPPAGGEYIVTVTKNGERTQHKYNKTELVSFLKNNDQLKFMLEYISKTKSLGRAKGRSRSRSTKSKSKSKSRSKSKSHRRH